MSGNLPPEEKVKLLREVIYNGQSEPGKFILTGFPDIHAHAELFESGCCNIKSIIYTVSEGNKVIEKLDMKNIDSHFQKEWRLQTLREWNYQSFQEKLG